MIAYFDCFSGISGDMTLGAFIDLGVSPAWLEGMLRRIPLQGLNLSVTDICRHGIGAKAVSVDAPDDETERNFATIKAMIQDSPMSVFVKDKSLAVFKRLAEAESKIHGCMAHEVHFHEVGGIDAIADIVGSMLCVEYLGIKKITASKLPLGTGFVNCRHGTLPVPAPATISLLEGVPAYGTSISCELVTPTGAAIITTLADHFGAMPDMTIERTGYGAGKREIENHPNLLRIITGTPSERKEERLVMVETCIDNMNPEFFGFVMERLFEDGALDLWWVPVFMKKNRPGTKVQVLCKKERRDAVIERLLSETTSLGVRYYNIDRKFLAREPVYLETQFGKVRAKQITELSGGVRIVPEYEACKKIALEKKLPIRVVYDSINSYNAYSR